VISGIHAIIFDLDGTLYSSEGFAGEIHNAACRYLAGLKGISAESAGRLIRESRARISSDTGRDITLTSILLDLGGDPARFHREVAEGVSPEAFLKRDDRVVHLVTTLANRFDLYIYTNNNRPLTDRILGILGISGKFQGVFTIEDFWTPKPDGEILGHILERIGRLPEECLFVGDRYDVDLRIPAESGSAVFLVTGVMDLLNLGRLASE
jgi:putative hydrolase of the HAD superfamily